MLTLGNKLTLNSQPIYHFVNKYSIDFDGVDDRIITDGADTVLQNTTYSFWCKSSTTASNKGVFGHGGQQIGSFHFNFDGSKPLLYLGTNLWVYWNDTSAQDDGEWHHYVVYSEPNDLSNCKLYVDGVLQTVSSIESSGSLNAYTESLTIGSERQVGGDSFEGKIDEFAVYDRELTQDEITRMYNTYYSPNRVANGNFAQIGNEEVENGDFSQIGSELVTNGDFASDTDWTKQTGWSISGGSANYDFTTNIKYLRQTLLSGGFVSGKSYRINFEITDGTAYMNIKSNAETLESTNLYSTGSYSIYVTASANGSDLLIYGVNTQGTAFSIDNVSVKEVGQDWTIEDVWTIGDSVANGNGANGSSEQLVQNSVTTIGKIYKVSYEILNYVSGSVFLPNVGSIQSGNGIYTEYITATQTDLKVTGTNFNGSITNISVKEVGQHWTFGTGWGMGDGVATSDGTTENLDQDALITGKTYKAKVTVSNMTTGTLSYRLGGSSSNEIINISSNGEYTANGISGGVTLRLRSQSGFDGSVDNIVVQELKHDATNLMLNAGAYQSANPLITSTKSMEFDGTDTTLEANNELSSGTYSFSAWVKRDTIPSVWQYIVDFRRGNTSSQYVAYNSTGGFGTGAGSDIVYVDGVASSTAPNDTKWHHIVVTGLSIANSSKINIGSRYTALEAMDGKITEVGTWDRTLTDLEVASLYNQGMPTNLLVNRNNYQSGNPTVFNTKQVDFDGVDDYMIANSTLGSMTGTFSFWFKRDTASTQHLLDIRGGSGEGYIYFSGSNLSASVSSGTIYVNGVAGSVNMALNQWHHLVVTGITLNITEFIAIGSRFNSLYFFNGQMSQVGLWNSTLTADEVSSLYNHGLPIDLTTNQAAYESSSNLVGYWRMGSGTLDSYPLIADQTNATLGSEQVVNGDFATDSDWSKDAGWTISNNIATYSNLGTAGNLEQNIGAVTGKTYKVMFTTSADASGNFAVSISGSTTFVSSVSPSTTYTLFFVAAGVTLRLRATDSFSGSITNASVKQVNGNPAIMTNQTSSDIENGSPYANILQDSSFTLTGTQAQNTGGTYWTTETGWTISDGKAIQDGSASGVGSTGDLVSSGVVFEIGKTYLIQVDIVNYVSGDIGVTASNTPLSITKDGSYHINYTATTTYLHLRAGYLNFVGSIDNVTISEVNTGLQGYWKMGDGTNDEYPVIYDQTNPTNGSELSSDTNFSSPSSWNTGTNTTITNNKATLTVTGGGLQYATNIGLDVVNTKTYKFVFTANRTSGTGNIVFGYDSGNSVSDSPQISTSGTQTIYFKPTYNTPNLGFKSYTGSGDYIWEISDFSVKEVNGNYATMTNMVEGNITNQYPLTKIRNYYRMGDGILDGYPIIQDQTSPNLAHIPTTNLYDFSEDFSSWSYSPRYSLSYGFLSPDGTNNATKLTAANPDPYIFKNITGATALTYSASIYIKGTTSTIGEDARLWIIRDNVDFPFQDFTITGEWQRIKFTTSFGTTPTSSVYLRLDAPNTNVQIGDEVYIFGAQLEAQSQATAYIKSDGIAAVRKASTTNLLPYSEDFSGYTIGGITLTSQTETSPINTNDATLVTFTSGGHYLRKDVTVTANTVYTLSFYVKRGTATGLKYRMRDITNNVDILAPTSYYSETSNDWKRIQVTVTTPATCTTLGAYVFSDGGSTGTAFLWGVQLEEQTQAETYAKTTGLPVTIDLFTENSYGTMTNMSSSDIVEDTP